MYCGLVVIPQNTPFLSACMKLFNEAGLRFYSEKIGYLDGRLVRTVVSTNPL